MRKWIVVVGAIAIVCASIGVETGRGQGGGGSGASGSVIPAPVDLPGSTSNPFAGRGGGGGGGGFSGIGARGGSAYVAATPLSSEARESQIQIRQLTHRLREATDDAAKADLTKQLETAVGKYFDEDMKTRETQLSQLEERVTKLRAQLDRRRKAKDDITKLQTKVLVNDADGLGFGDLQPENGSLFARPTSAAPATTPLRERDPNGLTIPATPANPPIR
jgi:hypothetical protein